jgi:hypothetical protein
VVVIIKRKENQNVKRNVLKEEQNIVFVIHVVVNLVVVQKENQINQKKKGNPLKDAEENINFII